MIIIEARLCQLVSYTRDMETRERERGREREREE